MVDATWSGELNGEATDTKQDPSMIEWERFLPRMFLRVLLVEGDDSTRQIITALLRKCNYKVTAVSNGLKAWTILKENSENIDLILTEVELASITGFDLLTMIMEHDTCKKIPVIMMSSQDSMNLVFKCMLRGAADFLVKPIRKNELRNLWQHVWRRHISNSSRRVLQDVNLAEQKLDATSENNAASNHSSDYEACMEKNRECSEEGSDALSSCTKPHMEVERTHMHTMRGLLQPGHRSTPTMIDAEVRKCKDHDKLGVMLSTCEHEAAAESMRPGVKATPGGWAVNSNDIALVETCDCSGVMVRNENLVPVSGMKDANTAPEIDADNNYNNNTAKPSREAIDLIGVIDNQSKCSCRYIVKHTLLADVLEDAGNLPDEIDDMGKFSLPLLELSLRRSQSRNCENKGIEERCTLQHSNSSAFSWYNNRTLQPTRPSHSEPQDYVSGSQNPLSIQGHDNAHHSQWNGIAQHSKWKDSSSLTTIPPSQDKTAFPCPQIGVVRAPIPIRSTARDGHSRYDALRPHLFYPQSEPSIRNKNSTNQQDATHANSSHQSNPGNDNSNVNYHHRQDQNADKPTNQPVLRQEQNLELAEDPTHIPFAMNEGGTRSLCNGSKSLFNNSQCRSVCNGNNMNVAVASVAGAIVESENGGESISHDRARVIDYQQHSSQRQAALTKFRLKRKDRCYEKKVRYQSRKRLAEQRPRVKGQFVRQIHSDPHPPSVEMDCSH